MRIFLSPPHMSGGELAEIENVFATNFIAPVGPHIAQFESDVAKYLGNDVHCVALSSGTAALHIALLIAGIGVGDRIWGSSMTFGGGVFPARYCGAEISFFDVNPHTWTLCPNLVEQELAAAKKKNKLPKAIIATEIYGQPIDIDSFERLSEQYNVKLIIDSAESLGATYSNNAKAGSLGDAAILSFNGNKIITTSGGGMLVTKHKAWAEKALFLATQAKEKVAHYEHKEIGYNYRLSNISAAIGVAQLRVLDDRVRRRRAIFENYHDRLSKLGFDLMPEAPGCRSNRWLTTVLIDPLKHGFDSQYLGKHLLNFGIETRPLWKPMHLQPVFQNTLYHGSGCDEDLFKKGICLPSGSSLTNVEQSNIIEKIVELCSLISPP